MNEKTVTEIIEEVTSAMCEKYCKFSGMGGTAEEKKAIAVICENCPLHKLN